jgi:hypothetical protein
LFAKPVLSFRRAVLEDHPGRLERPRLPGRYFNPLAIGAGDDRLAPFRRREQEGHADAGADAQTQGQEGDHQGQRDAPGQLLLHPLQ